MGNILSCCPFSSDRKGPQYRNLPKENAYRQNHRTFDTADGDIVGTDGGIWDDQVTDSMKLSSVTVTESAPRNRIVSDSTLDFPFLNDNSTIAHMKKAHTMIIMRGLPGSGKSTITTEIKRVYPDVVVCSADQYFIKDGVFRFNFDELGAAHGSSQKLAQTACEKQKNIVVIDNTNVKRWEMKFYLDLAKTCGYTVLLVSPKTSWCMDAEELARRNTHGVDVNKIRERLKSYDECVPFYYGWFLTLKDSENLYELCKHHLAHDVSTIRSFTQGLGLSGSNVLEYFSLHENQKKPLHCTAKFMGSFRNPAPDRDEYHQRQEVQKAYGKVFKLQFTGIIFSQSVVGVRVNLKGETTLALHDKPEEKERDKLIMQKRNLHREVSNIEDTTHDFVSKVITNVDYPYVGRSAHVTIATAKGIQAKQTNADLLDICDLEQEIIDNNSNVIGHRVRGGVLKSLEGKSGEQFCVIYLDEPISAQCMFSGYY